MVWGSVRSVAAEAGRTGWRILGVYGTGAAGVSLVAWLFDWRYAVIAALLVVSFVLFRGYHRLRSEEVSDNRASILSSARAEGRRVLGSMRDTIAVAVDVYADHRSRAQRWWSGLLEYLGQVDKNLALRVGLEDEIDELAEYGKLTGNASLDPMRSWLQERIDRIEQLLSRL